MLKTQFTLIAKKTLTHDVYELSYSCPALSGDIPKPGQYVMFQLAPGLNRSYSIARYAIDTFSLIIKRIPDGKGSPFICDADIGTIFSGILPLGHFLLRDTPVAKCFIGTGTGFAPLYCQMLGCIDRGLTDSSMAFIFGVRDLQDVLYTEEIRVVSDQIENFVHRSYLSRVDVEGHIRGYVTDWITTENIAPFQEFYICGSPAMVRSAREKLEALGVKSERIFWEQF